MEDFMRLALSRESCRDYSEKPVEREKLVRCLEAARIAPSACNSQPWRFTVVTDPEVLPRLAACVQDAGMNKFASRCPALVVVTEEKANLSAKLGGLVKDQQYAQIDVGLAAAHFCLEAADQGLSTCILGWFSEKRIKDLLALPERARVRLVLCVGYAAREGLREKKRKSLEEIVRFIG